MEKQKIINNVASYYTEKLQTFGATPKGVDWNSSESQELRFNQLLRVLKNDFSSEKFSILDYGCGFGAMFSFMKKLYGNNFSFVGYDISDEMIAKAKELYKNEHQTQWINQTNNQKVDFTVASGIFNVRLQHQQTEWENYILEVLQNMNEISQKGFSFNMLTSYSDKEFMKDYLYYANPSFFFDYCKKYFSKYVTILHDYPLYEFTIIVRKEL